MLQKWNKQLNDHQNWENFKEHLHFAYKFLKAISTLTIKDTLNYDDVMNLVTAGINNMMTPFMNNPVHSIQVPHLKSTAIMKIPNYVMKVLKIFAIHNRTTPNKWTKPDYGQHTICSTR